jgi:2-dehydropantoate 2-reductase
MNPDARSSMWEDLTRGRPTEVDDLNGAIVRLSDEIGVPAPLHRRIVTLVKDAERAQRGSPGLSGDELWRRLHAST